MEYFGPEVSSYRYRIGLDRPYYCEHTIGVCLLLLSKYKGSSESEYRYGYTTNLFVQSYYF